MFKDKVYVVGTKTKGWAPYLNGKRVGPVRPNSEEMHYHTDDAFLVWVPDQDLPEDASAVIDGRRRSQLEW